VEDVVGWVTLTQAQNLWRDAADLDAAELTTYLLSAYEACVEFAPELEDGAEIPESWRLAQVMQARAQMRALTAGRDDNLAADGLTVTVYPLDWNVRQLLRPKRGRPRVG